MRYSKNHQGINAVFLLTLIAAAVAAPARAAEGDTPTAQDLDQRVRILERQLEIQKEESEARAKDAAIVSADSKGFSIKNAKGDYELKFGGLIQADYRFYNGDNNVRSNDQFLLRRVEPSISGSLGKYLGFLITPQFASNTAPSAATGSNSPSSTGTLLDYWLELRFDAAATVRAGRFKEPVGLENLQSSNTLTFIERGLPTDLVPGRDVGLQVQGQLFGKTLSYAVGVFNGAADGGDAASGDTDNRHDIAARIFAEPFKNHPGLLQNLGFGVAGTRGATYGQANGAQSNLIASSSSGYVSPGQQKFFNYTATTAAAGLRTHVSPQAYWYHRNYGVLAEYVISTQTVQNGATVTRFDNEACQVQANYVITGEDASFRGVKPSNPFKIGEAGWGAFEVAARSGGLNIDNGAFAGGVFASATASARQAREYGVAANWYLNSNAKLGLNYEETRYKGGAAVAAGTDRENERAILARFQVAF
jgi:phosphate-selective porin OprO/OprP